MTRPTARARLPTSRNAQCGTNTSPGIIYVDTSRRDFHAQHGTADEALNAVPYERLCPGAGKLGKILTAFR